MLTTKPPNYKYCPFCGKLLQTKIEEGKTRKYCSTDKWTYYPSVFQSANAIITKRGKILLVKRNREPYTGKWMFPAGFVNYEEHPSETLVREVREETGLTVKNAQLFDVIQTIDDPRYPGYLAFYYKVSVKGELTNNDSVENSEIGWFSLNNLPPLAWRDHKKIVAEINNSKAND